MIRELCLCAMAIGLMVTASCRVAETGEDQPNVCSGDVVTVKSQPHRVVDAEVRLLPPLSRVGRRPYFRSLADDWQALAGQGRLFGSLIRPHLDLHDEEDGAAFQGMNDRLWQLNVSPGMSWPTKLGLFGLSAAADTLSAHRGQDLEFSYTFLFGLSGVDLIPSAGMRWRSQNLVDYYYGGQPGEARAGRVGYEGERALDPFVRLALRRRLTQQWSLLAAAQYEWLDDTSAESPITDANHDASVIVGMVYSW